MPEKLQEATVCVVGLGLMGGSLAAALSRGHYCRKVIGVARRQVVLEKAINRCYISEGFLDLSEALPSADVVILATPVREIISQVKQLQSAAPGTLILDLGSTKQQICEALNALPAGIEPIGGHPMCGKATSGLDEADPELYRSKVFVLCPLARTSPAAMAICTELIDAVGARQLILDPARHDKLVAYISHLPYLAAAALVNTTSETAAEDSLVWDLASSGFRDTTRLAASDVTMMLDILLTNRESILAALARVRKQLNKLSTALEADDRAELVHLLASARDLRKELFT